MPFRQKPLDSVLVKPAGPDCNMDCTYCFYLEKDTMFPESRIHRMREDVLEEMVKLCCRIKRGVVMADEKDTGLRRILNFGHTVGHAVEACTNYRVPHGMAVSMGMAVESVLSARMGVLSHGDTERILNLLGRYGLPTRIPNGYDIEKILDIPIGNRRDYLVPLKTITDVKETVAPNSIERKDFKRSTTIYADIKEHSGLTPVEIAEELEYKEKKVFNALKKLFSDGKINSNAKTRQYYLVEE